MNRNVRLVPAIAIVILAMLWCYAPEALAAPASPPKVQQYKTINANAWIMKTSNYGEFVCPGGGSGGFWGGPGYNYIYGAGLWVAAIDTDGSPRVTVGFNHADVSDFGPANPYTWDWTNWATDSVSRMYLSTDSADLADWPLRDAGNAPIVRSLQDGYCTYSDANPAFAYFDSTPVGVRVRQSSYVWNAGFNADVVYFTFTVINATADLLRNVYVGPQINGDIGNEGGSSANDRTDFDAARDLAIQYQTVQESGWPVTGQFGCMYLHSPDNNTGDTVHVVDNQFPRDIAPGGQLGMTAFKIFGMDFPVGDSMKYSSMQGRNMYTGVMNAYDESGATDPGDWDFVMSSGPFHLAAGDSVTVTMAVLAAPSRDSLLDLADSAQAFYDGGMAVGGGPAVPSIPAATVLMQCSPNPFAHTTELVYDLAAPADVSLRIYNAVGQPVRTLATARQAAGTHRVRWNGRNDAGRPLSAGVYLYRLQAGEKTMTRKLVLVR